MPRVKVGDVVLDGPAGTEIKVIPDRDKTEAKPELPRRVSWQDRGRDWRDGDNVTVCYCGSPMCDVCG